MEEGTETSIPTDYEPFTNGASPNPEYPQEIEVLEGDLSYKVNGKNLLKGNGTTISYGLTNTLENGKVTLNGTIAANWSIILLKIKQELDIGTYTLSRSSSYQENKVFRYELVLKFEDGTSKTIYSNSDNQGKIFTIDKKGLAAITSSFFATLRASFSSADVVHIHAEGPSIFCWLRFHYAH
jgi:hypothetical protein